MLFLCWLLGSFVVVGAINLYLRHFGLPRSRAVKHNGNVFTASSLSFGSAVHGTGSFAHGSGSFISAFGGGGGGGDGTSWINSAIVWIYQRCHQTPDVVDTWLKSLTTEAEKQSKDIQFRFDGIHGSPPEISNIRVEDSTSESFTIFANLSVKDVTLRLCSVTSATGNPVNCDVYLYYLKGQMKVVTKYANNNEIIQHASFISPTEMKVQIRQTRIDKTLDTSLIEKIARAAIASSTTNLTWTPPYSMKSNSGLSSSTNRSASVHESITSQRQVTLGSSINKPFREQAMTSSMNQQFREQPMMSSMNQQFREQPMTSSMNPQYREQPMTSSMNQQYREQPMTSQMNQHQQYIEQPMTSSLDQQYRDQPMMSSLDQSMQQSSQNSNMNNNFNAFTPRQDATTPQNDVTAFDASRVTQGGMHSPNTQSTLTSLSSSSNKLLIRVIKANGLIDADFGSCSAYCLVILDNPRQSFTTNFVKNTVNPYWDEQFVFETNSSTKQIQMEVLDREREQGGELLGKASVLLDEIRRMPSSRQIIPLTGKPRSRTSTSGSVTVEFVFMDAVQPVPVEQIQQSTFSGSYSEPQRSFQGQGDIQGQGQSMTADYSPYAGTRNAAPLSAHNLALSTGVPSGALRTIDSPTVVVTGAEPQRFNTLQPSYNSGAQDGSMTKKKESFASALKKKFNKMKQPRSQSADRATGNRSPREGRNLLTLPSDRAATLQTTDAKQSSNTSISGGSQNFDVDGSRKARSNSFSSSLKRIFKRDKKDMSRESSLTRPNTDPYNRQLSSSQQDTIDRSRRQTTPVPPDSQYSVSVPSAPSPLQSR